MVGAFMPFQSKPKLSQRMPSSVSGWYSWLILYNLIGFVDEFVEYFGLSCCSPKDYGFSFYLFQQFSPQIKGVVKSSHFGKQLSLSDMMGLAQLRSSPTLSQRMPLS